jgi:hypothetical protein
MNFNKKLAVAISGAVLLMAGQFALADSATDIVDALVSKGVLTEEEGKLITKGHTSKVSVTPVVKEKDGAFTLESANGRNSISLTGRMHLDYRFNDAFENGRNEDRDSQSLSDQFELRRARIGVKGKLAKDFKYEIVTNIPGTATVDVAYLDFAKYDQVQLRVGKFKQPFNLEEQISSNNITFMERSYINQTAPGKKLGLMVMGAPTAGMTYAGSVFQHNDTELNINADGKNSAAGRATLNFAEIMGNKEMIMHVGIAGLTSNYAIGTASSGQTATDYATTTSTIVQRGTINSFRSAGRGLNNAFRGQVGGDARRVAFFPGSTIGNLHPDEASRFLGDVRDLTGTGGGLVLGVDRRKDAEILDAAYNDAQGVTAEFNLNMLTHLNRECGADFDRSAYRHDAFFNEDESRVEMHLVAVVAHTFRIFGDEFHVAEGESILTEVSYMYDRERLDAVATAGGWTVEHLFTDDKDWFWVAWLRPV